MMFGWLIDVCFSCLNGSISPRTFRDQPLVIEGSNTSATALKETWVRQTFQVVLTEVGILTSAGFIKTLPLI